MISQIHIILLLIIISSLFYLVIKISENTFSFFTKKAIISYTMIILIIVLNCITIVSSDIQLIYKMILQKNNFILFFAMMYTLSTIELFKKKKVKIELTAIFAIVPIMSLFVTYIPQLNVYFLNYTSFIANNSKQMSYGNTFFTVSLSYFAFCTVLSIITYFRIYKRLYVDLKKIIIVSLGILFFFINALISWRYFSFSNSVVIIGTMFYLITYLLCFVSKLYLYIDLKKCAIENIVNEQSNIIVAVDLNGFVMFANQTILRLFNLKRKNILGESIYNSEAVGRLFPTDFFQHLTNEKSGDIITYDNKSYKKMITPLYKNNILIGELINLKDITDELNYSKTFKEIIVTDKLTSFGNRYSFELDSNKIDDEEHNLLSLVLIDLDNLKITNDVFGSDKGDEIILTLSFLIKDAFGSENFIGYRLGGDEFCIIISGQSEKDVAYKIDQLYLETSNYNTNNQHQILFSVGCASRSEKCKTVAELYRFADISLYKSKKDGKNRTTYFSNEIYNKYMLGNKLKDDFDKAISHGDFSPYFKPIFNISKNSIDSCEIVSYWNHMELGLLPEDDFYPLNHDLDSHKPLEFIMLEESLHHLSVWSKKYNKKPINIFMKISIINIANGNIVSFVKEVCKKYSIKSDTIIFEIREKNLINTGDLIEENVSLLRAMGIKFLIGEFGKGSANFETIEFFDADYIKIDKQAVFACDISKHNKDNLELICRLLKSYDCEIISEGVSKQEQFEMLNSFGVEHLQGSLFGEAVNAETFEKIYYQ